MTAAGDDDSMPFSEAGDPLNPAIVFLHAGPLSRRMWEPQLALLSSSFHCFAPDLPDHGSNARTRFSLELAADQVSALVRKRASARGPPALVGLSLGGALVLELLRRHPRIASRAMVSGTTDGIGPWLGRMALAAAGATSWLSPETQAGLALWQVPVRPRFRHLVFDDLVRGSTPEYTRDTLRELMSMRMPDRVECPLLVTVGSKETIPARRAAARIVRAYPGARGAVAPGLNHLWNLEEPELFARVVEAWVGWGEVLSDLKPIAGR
ncbi:Alpha/Beta hydrolase protein [Hyaloraphidium curvatum]|nr:Alpha/Beta hydrolase protein [Hyaloraphidium curvatum]